jgi:hypothetical protein
MPAPGHAVLVVQDLTGPTPTVTELAETLIGPGITISNVTYTGALEAAGTFTGGAGILDIESGILLSSGRVLDAVGPNSQGSTTTGFGTSGDPDLDALAEVAPGAPTADAAVLEFDFVATSPVVQFRYVFGSDEYNEFANSGFNDVFGFFINGVNVALIPDSETPVAINNVNGGFAADCENGIDDDGDGLVDNDDPDCTTPGDNIVGENYQNAEFYVDNDCYSAPIPGGCPIDIEADGLTVVLTIAAAVLPGTNHVKLAIQDVGDTAYDSWVFIEAESFVPANDSWLNAEEIVFNSPGTATGRIDSPGVSRWYKFAIQPGAQVTVELTNPPADYDIALFKDIAQAFVEQIVPSDAEDLDRLNAEFAPTAFSPTAFSPWAFSPWAFSPTAFSPTAFSPDEFAPFAFSPTAFSPTAFSPTAFSPWAFSPFAFSPFAFSPTAFSPTAFSPETSPTAFSDAFVGAQVASLIAVSAGTGTERLVADTWNNTGDFYIRVTGKNGANDPLSDFQLSVVLESGFCADIVVPSAADVAAEPNIATAGNYETIILWDSGRMDAALAGNSPANIADLTARLGALAARPEVNGVVVDLAGMQHIGDLHAQADSLSSCPFAVNLTAKAIKRVIDDYRALNPLRYVVIAGGDGVIPFFRYPDQSLLGPEIGYDPPVAELTISQGSLRTNHVLGQDEYGAEVLSLRDGEFPVPILAVGRLVESAAEMIIVLDAYLDTADGIIETPDSTLVTGYDFLEDTANAIQENLVAGTPGRNDTLITAAHIAPADPLSWKGEDLRRELLDEGEDIIFLAGHFSANSALAADYETILVTTQLEASSVDLTNSIVYSAGCHSGYNIVDEHGVPGVTLLLDWPQAFARKGATLIAGTGYQYGDTDFIEYSERLYLEFTKRLRTGPNFDGTGPVAVGEALTKAKQRYLAQTPDIRGLHRKSVLISTLFGLPMLRVDMPGSRLVDDATASAVTALTPYIADPGLKLGLQFADVTFDFSAARPEADGLLQPVQVALENVEDGGTLVATYLKGPDGVVTNPAEPALPLAVKNVTFNNYSARGLGFRGGSWFEQTVVPLTGAPATEIRGVHIPFSSPVNFPMRFATLNYFDTIAGGGNTSLLVTPAQHRVPNFGTIDATLRQFGNLAFRLYYSNNTQTFGVNTPALAAPPSMSGARAVVDGDDIVFLVNVFGDPAAGIQSVWVTYTDGSESYGVWTSIDLVQADPEDSTLWSGRLVDGVNTFGRLDAIFQAVNGVGLVSLNDNFGGYYQIAGNLGEVGPDGANDNLVPSELTLTGPTSGGFGDEITLQATLTSEGETVDGAQVLFTLGLSARGATTFNGIADASLTLTPLPGDYKIVVSYDGDNTRLPSSAELPFTVEKAGTALTLTSGPQAVSVDGVDTGVNALLVDENGVPLPERTVYFTATNSNGLLITVPVITDNVGQAHLGTLALPGAGDYQLTARFLGEIPIGNGDLLTLDDPVYNPSSATMFDDFDGVYSDADFCANTTTPESVPTVKLNPNHWALTDLDFNFDTVVKGKGNGPGRSYTLDDTAGCSCEQIIENQALDDGHTNFGCSIGAMDEWVELMKTAP